MSENYVRLPFNQYFIDTSCNCHGYDTVRDVVEYKSVPYGNGHEANYAVVLDKERKCIQVHFEKTSGDIDWQDNFNFPKKMYDTFEYEGKPLTLYVHSGWGDMYKAMKHELHEDFDKLRKRRKSWDVEVIGWSLGSAMAQLCVQDLNWRYGIRPYCYTFGSVKPFFYSSGRTEKYLRECRSDTYNFCHKSDIVTYQPPFIGFHMMERVDVGSFSLPHLFNPMEYHTLYNRSEIYDGVE